MALEGKGLASSKAAAVSAETRAFGALEGYLCAQGVCLVDMPINVGVLKGTGSDRRLSSSDLDAPLETNIRK